MFDLLELNDQEIIINVYYKMTKNKFGVKHARVYKDEELNQIFSKKDQNGQDLLLKDEEKVAILKEKEIVKLQTKWKLLNFKQLNSIAQMAQIPGDKQHVNIVQYRELTIKAALKDWDAKDSAGVLVPFQQKLIDKLPDVVFHELYNKYRDYVQPNEQQEKK